MSVPNSFYQSLPGSRCTWPFGTNDLALALRVDREMEAIWRESVDEKLGWKRQ